MSSPRTGKKTQIPLHLARKYFTYNPATGVLLTKLTRGQTPIGTRIYGGTDKKGAFARISVDGKPYTVLSICFALGHDRMPEWRLGVRDGNAKNLELRNIVEIHGTHRIPRTGGLSVGRVSQAPPSPNAGRIREALGVLLTAYRADNPEGKANLPELLEWAGKAVRHD